MHQPMQTVVAQWGQPEDTRGLLRHLIDDMEKMKTVRRARESTWSVIQPVDVVQSPRGPLYVGWMVGNHALHGGHTRGTHNRCWRDVRWFCHTTG